MKSNSHFLQECFYSKKYMLLDFLEPIPYQTLSILSVLFDNIILPNDFIIEFFNNANNFSFSLNYWWFCLPIHYSLILFLNFIELMIDWKEY